MYKRQDKDSRVTSITDKRGFTTGFDYDAHGNIQVVTDKTGLKSHLESVSYTHLHLSCYERLRVRKYARTCNL